MATKSLSFMLCFVALSYSNVNGLAKRAKPRVNFTQYADKLLKSLKFYNIASTLAESISEKVEDVVKGNSISASGFFEMKDVMAITESCKLVPNLNMHTLGGFPSSTRKRIIFTTEDCDELGPQFVEEYNEIEENDARIGIVESYLAAISIKSDISSKDLEATNIEVQEALMANCNIAPNQLGDIIRCGPDGVQVVIDAAIAPQLYNSGGGVSKLKLNAIGDRPVVVQPIRLSALRPRTVKQKKLTIVEASIRLDAVASGGLGLSRSKMSKLINKGEITVNCRPATNAAANVQAGQIIGTSGGRQLTIIAIAATSKGNYKIECIRSS